MATLTIQDLPDTVHQALSARAVGNGRSLDAEVREILEKATERPRERETGAVLVEIGKRMALTEGKEPAPRSKADMDLGSLLYTIGREAELTDEEVALYFNSLRDKTPMRVASFDDPA